MADKLNSTLQENLITILAYDEVHGKIVARLVNPSLFEGEYRVIAERCIDFWNKYGAPPLHHTPDLFADILDDPNNRKAITYRRILSQMLQLSESMNTKYVMDQAMVFTRGQKLKDTIIKSADILNARQEMMANAEVEELWAKILRTNKDTSYNAGLKLTDFNLVVDTLEQQQDEFVMGIGALDERHISPYRDAVVLMIGPTGKGKTWFMVHVGRHALMRRKKVLHITLELSAERTMMRYYQALFAASKRDPRVTSVVMEKDRRGALTGLDREDVKASFTFSSPHIRDELEQRINYHGALMENLRVVRFPPHSLTMTALDAYIENLEITERFIPDMLILDYIRLVKVNTNDLRISLGQALVEFRGICVDRHLAGITAQQASKVGYNATTTGIGHVSEDWSLTNTADINLTYSSTDEEFALGLGRMYVGKGRDESDRFGVLLSQNYTIGQFALDSVKLSDKYWDMAKELDSGVTGKDDDYGEEDD